MRHAVLALALLAAGCVDPDGPATGGTVPRLEAAAARLPANVAGFTRGEATWHERTTPGLGVAVDYAGPSRSAVATVSLYDRGRRPDAASLTAEFDQALVDVMGVAGARTGQVITERERTSLPVSVGPPLQCARLAGTYGRQEVTTLVCLGEADGRFLKTLVTWPSRQVRPVDPLPFVTGIAAAARAAE
jgi:hypothetical protein